MVVTHPDRRCDRPWAACSACGSGSRCAEWAQPHAIRSPTLVRWMKDHAFVSWVEVFRPWRLKDYILPRAACTGSAKADGLVFLAVTGATEIALIAGVWLSPLRMTTGSQTPTSPGPDTRETSQCRSWTRTSQTDKIREHAASVRPGVRPVSEGAKSCSIQLRC